MVDYNKLNEMLESALTSETSESWNEWLDGRFEDSQLIDVVSTLDVSSFETVESTDLSSNTWSHGIMIERNAARNDSAGNNEYAIAA